MAASFHFDALVALAGSLRGRPCSCDPSRPRMSGAMNWAAVVAFDDGVEWIFRSPHSGFSTVLDAETVAKLLASEVATLQHIRSHTTVPVPEVFAFSAYHENDIGVPYILMSKAPGHPLSEYDWQRPGPRPSQSLASKPTRPLSQPAAEKVMGQLGAIVSQLWQLRMDKIGSPCWDDQRLVAGECLVPAFAWERRDSLDDIDRGPFDSEQAYLDAVLSAYTAHAEALPLTPHAFFAPVPVPSEYPSWASYRAAVSRWNDFVAVGQKIEQSDNCFAYCVAGQLMREMLPRLCSSDYESTGFPLAHPDLHAGNIFVDDDLRITCIVDWASASSVPMAEALVTPSLQGSTTPPDASLVAAFRAGFERAEGGASIPPAVWTRVDMMWFFQCLTRMLGIRDYDYFEAFYALAQKAGSITDDNNDPVDIPRLFRERMQRPENRQLLDELRMEDDTTDSLQKLEQECFGSGPEVDARVAVARKLALASKMNDGFVADKKLWLWIERALEHDD